MNFYFLCAEVQIKQTWVDLKKRYKEHLNLSKTHSGDGFPEDVDWGILHELDFLKESVQNRPVVSTLTNQLTIPSMEFFLEPDIAEIQHERQFARGDGTNNLWQTTQGVKQMVNKHRANLPEVVPRYDAFAMRKQGVMEQSLHFFEDSAKVLKNMISKLEDSRNQQGREKTHGIEDVQKERIKELFLSIPINQHREFYLDMVAILNRYH